VDQSIASFVSDVALTSREPDDSGLSLYGSSMALPQLPSAPSKCVRRLDKGIKFYLPPNSLTL
jgi:hypothetical protein